MSIGAGIAIAAIWIGVGIAHCLRKVDGDSWWCAMVATIVICFFSTP